MAAFNSTLTERDALDGSAAPAVRQPWHRPQVAELPPDEAPEARRRLANLDTASELAAAGPPTFPAVVESRGDGTWFRPDTKPPHANGVANGHAHTHATLDEKGATEAIRFLGRFHPSTPWALATFGPGDNEVGPAHTFDPSNEQDRDAAYRFILELQGKHNVYFTVNCVGSKISKKASKRDIVEIHYLHVDADLPKDLDWSDPAAVVAAKQRVLEQLRAYEPPPTAIIWSGGGFQAFWRLSEIIIVNGDKDLMTRIERRMRRIEKAFGADSCHNADRIMRVPGSMNVLGTTKVRAGRKPERAELVEFHDDRIYDPEEFPELDEPRSNGARQHAAPKSDDFERARDALRNIPADDYDLYLKIGMALMSGFGDAGFTLYREWAVTSIRFDDNNIRAKWRSIKPEGGVNLGTLFYMAREHGWRDAEGPSSDRGERHSDVEQKSDVAPDMSIVFRNKLPAPTFPTHVLGHAERWVQITAAMKNAPVEYVALSLIVAAASMIGPKRRVKAWDGWEEPSIVWGILVGDPSILKSPALDPFRDEVRALERQLNQNFEQRKAEYKVRMEMAEEAEEKWKEAVKKAAREGKVPLLLPKDAIKPEEPTRIRLYISDITTEKIARLLGKNHGGLLNVRDEVVGVLAAFDKYGGAGSDRAFWLEAYGGRPHRYDRVSLGDESIDIPFCAVCLLGSIQPDKLNKILLTGDDDGLAARPIYAWPDPVRSRRPTEGVKSSELKDVLCRLRALAFDRDRDNYPVPRVKQLANDAMLTFQGWWEGKQWDAKRRAGSNRIAGAIGKFDGMVLRLAQVFELLEWAWINPNEPEPEQISLESVNKAIYLIDHWVQATLERVFAEADLPEVHRDAMVVARWFLKHQPEAVNSRELRRQPGYPGTKDTKRLDGAMEFLVEARWLIPPRPSGKPGRPSKDFEVNQKVYTLAEKFWEGK